MVCCDSWNLFTILTEYLDSCHLFLASPNSFMNFSMKLCSSNNPDWNFVLLFTSFQSYNQGAEAEQSLKTNNG